MSIRRDPRGLPDASPDRLSRIMAIGMKLANAKPSPKRSEVAPVGIPPPEPFVEEIKGGTGPGRTVLHVPRDYWKVYIEFYALGKFVDDLEEYHNSNVDKGLFGPVGGNGKWEYMPEMSIGALFPIWTAANDVWWHKRGEMLNAFSLSPHLDQSWYPFTGVIDEFRLDGVAEEVDDAEELLDKRLRKWCDDLIRSSFKKSFPASFVEAEVSAFANAVIEELKGPTADAESDSDEDEPWQPRGTGKRGPEDTLQMLVKKRQRLEKKHAKELEELKRRIEITLGELENSPRR